MTAQKKATKKSSASSTKGAEKTKDSKKTSKKSPEGRFIGFQKSPIHTAFFGKSSRSGSVQDAQTFKHSTGPVQKIERQWYLLDATEAPVGRLASVAATILMGKHKAGFTPGADSGDSVVVINATKSFFTSNKADRKIYYRHTGYPGGMKSESARDALVKHPEKVIWDAVYGMMPKNRLSRIQLPRLKVVHAADHEMAAQKPQKLELKGRLLKSIQSQKQAQAS